jgi:hypothetical protein
MIGVVIAIPVIVRILVTAPLLALADRALSAKRLPCVAASAPDGRGRRVNDAALVDEAGLPITRQQQWSVEIDEA